LIIGGRVQLYKLRVFLFTAIDIPVPDLGAGSRAPVAKAQANPSYPGAKITLSAGA
jgi:hypothetical protein